MPTRRSGASLCATSSSPACQLFQQLSTPWSSTHFNSATVQYIRRRYEHFWLHKLRVVYLMESSAVLRPSLCASLRSLLVCTALVTPPSSVMSVARSCATTCHSQSSSTRNSFVCAAGTRLPKSYCLSAQAPSLQPLPLSRGKTRLLVLLHGNQPHRLLTLLSSCCDAYAFVSLAPSFPAAGSRELGSVSCLIACCSPC